MAKIVYYTKADGTVPVADFILELPPKHQAKALRDIDILEEYGAKLKMPYAEQIDGKLWQLRIQSSGDISRIFYFAHAKDTFVLLHAFIKKTPRTPTREIAKAKSNMEDFLRRNLK